MPFYQRAFFNPAVADNAFTNIFQLINDIDSYQHEASAPACKPQPQLQKQQRVCKPRHEHAAHHRRSGLNDFASVFGVARPFNPRFDVRETDSTYELHGELAGVDRNNVSLEFTEPQTLVISGNVERNYSSSSPSTQQPAVAAAPEAVPEAIADTHSESEDEPILPDGARTPAEEDEPFTEIAAPRSPSPARSHRATVTDEATEDALERGQDVTNEKAAEAEVADPAEVAPEEADTPAQAQAAASSDRYWVQERAVGQFKRVFSFPVPVDEANVRANLENGILNVSIPKAKRETRRIVVF
ncbi:hypothetical protein SPBR_03114 [Sporothrix brasiliensis 5110]|uniref:SHSP domain-containing protein n=1 Tax=Sporothrix brasiliensis 5110 TaxID=1398154 RepID=A0A0C2F1G2_9PEZI|nr:uncharacterized protein SPBR_03114 [Sporothrix brasiliensis 5110]KIH92754.1 hypothetical protein SPBR_03114 [Sporothrix brasiliensis 5110]